jgi:hypothetical protein
MARIYSPARRGLEMTMESQPEVKPIAPETAGGGNDRSTVDFPYTDLDSAVEVAKGVHAAGGNACDSDQLAAELGLEAKGGGFRQRIGGAKTFDLITYERGGRITLTDLGRRMVDQPQERASRAQAFLAVELYQKVFEQFKGGPLPPQAGLDRALVSLGVGAGVKEKARQVMMRAAKQAGFLEYAADRLVKPSIKEEQRSGDQAGQDQPEKPLNRGGGSGAGGGGGTQHPLIDGLLLTLPKPGDNWAASDRANWLTMANSIFKMIYKGDAEGIEITMKTKTGGATSAAG